MTAAVELVGASKRYGSLEALKSVSFSIQPGEVVAMLGPNGAGKTTAISLMLGLRRPTGGEVRLFGLNPAEPAARSRRGAMLQESGVPELLRVRELVGVFASYYPRPIPVERAIAMAGLEDKAGSRVDRLSGGQRQRLYYALAVVGDPEVLFLDEPTVGMDVEARREFLDALRRSGRDGRTVVMTTHYLQEADQIAERIIVIDRGRVVADAPPAAIKTRVAGKRVSFASSLGVEAFRQLPVTGLQLEGERARFLTSRPEEVLRALFARGAELRDLEVVGADLEDAFLYLTRADREPAPV